MDLSNLIDHNMLDNVEETENELGSGSYGEVKVVLYQKKEYACKYLYPILSQGSSKTRNSFIEECHKALNIRHPNIVTVIGIWQPNARKMPALVMELMPYCLGKILPNESLPSSLKYSILHDVSEGLKYFHQIQLMHRDLTANNVLLTESLSAKISDFGQAKAINPDEINLQNTANPGCAIYMPPEAKGYIYDPQQKEMSRKEYSFQLDIFSFGVLILHCFLERFPEACAELIPAPNNPNLYIRQPPLKYFSKDIDRAVPEGHVLRSLVLRCLSVAPADRPSAIGLNSELRQILEEDESVFLKFKKMYDSFEIEKAVLVNKKTELEQQLHVDVKKHERMKEENELLGKENDKLKIEWAKLMKMMKLFKDDQKTAAKGIDEEEILDVSSDGTVKTISPPNTSPDDMMGIFQQSISQSSIDNCRDRDMLFEEVRRLKEINEQLKNEKEVLERRLQTQELEVQNQFSLSHRSLEVSVTPSMLHSMQSIPYDQLMPPTIEHVENVSVTSIIIIIIIIFLFLQEKRQFIDDSSGMSVHEVHRCTLPQYSHIHVEGAQAVSLQGQVYMGRATTSVLAYDRITKDWRMLPAAPCKNYALVNYLGQLVLVGGSNNAKICSEVYVWLLQQEKWCGDRITAMSVPRENAAAVEYGKYLLVMGGMTPLLKMFTKLLDSIEIYDCDTKQWQMAANLPRPGYMIHCFSEDSFLYILHSDGWAIRYCSLEWLIQTANVKLNSRGLWKVVDRNVPHTRSSMCVYNSSLLTVAGAGSNGHIYTFDPRDEKWKRVNCTGSLPAIKNAFCLRVGQKELFLCGGDIDMISKSSQTAYSIFIEDSSFESVDGESSSHHSDTESD